MKSSSVVQLMLDLATFGYVLSPKWKENSRGRTPQELAQSFLEVMSRWDRFDYTAKLRFRSRKWNARVKDRVIGCTPRADIIQFYNFDRMRHHAKPRTDDRPLSGRSRSDVTPWIEYSVTDRSSNFDWDVAQNLLVYRDGPTTQVIHGIHVYFRDLPSSLHVNQMSTNLPHPLTSSPKIELDSTKFSISIAGELLIMKRANETELLVVNWKTHKILLVSGFVEYQWRVVRS
jgi:hypothetical protein